MFWMATLTIESAVESAWNSIAPYGLPALRGRRRGDLHVVVNVMVPRNLSEEQRDLLKRFADSANGGNYEIEEEANSLLDRIRQALGG